MDRRSFLKTGGAAVAATGAAAATAGAYAEEAGRADAGQDAIARASVLRIRTALPGAFVRGHLRDRADRLALRIGELTQGRLALTFEPEGADGLGAVTANRADAYFGTEADHIATHAGLSYFAGLPGDLGLAPEQFATWLNAGSGQMLWDEIAYDAGVKSFAAGHSGRQPGVWSAVEFQSLRDMNAVPMSVYGLAKSVVETLGGQVAGIATAAKLVEPLTGPTGHLASADAQGHSIWYRDGIHNKGLVLSFGLSLKIWDALSDGDRAAIAAATSEAYHQSIAEHDAHDTGVAPHLMRAKGIRQMQLPDDVGRAVRHVARALVLDTAAADTQAARINESYMQFREIVAGLPAPSQASAAV